MKNVKQSSLFSCSYIKNLSHWLKLELVPVTLGEQGHFLVFYPKPYYKILISTALLPVGVTIPWVYIFITSL